MLSHKEGQEADRRKDAMHGRRGRDIYGTKSSLKYLVAIRVMVVHYPGFPGVCSPLTTRWPSPSSSFVLQMPRCFIWIQLWLTPNTQYSLRTYKMITMFKWFGTEGSQARLLTDHKMAVVLPCCFSQALRAYMDLCPCQYS